MKTVIYQESTKTWRVMPENYLLYGLLGWGDGKMRPYTDYAIGLTELEKLKDEMPEDIYLEVKKVIISRPGTELKA